MSSIVGCASYAPMSTVWMMSGIRRVGDAREARAALIDRQRFSRVQRRRRDQTYRPAGLHCCPPQSPDCCQQRVCLSRAAVVGQAVQDPALRRPTWLLLTPLVRPAGATGADQVERAGRIDCAADVVGSSVAPSSLKLPATIVLFRVSVPAAREYRHRRRHCCCQSQRRCW